MNRISVRTVLPILLIFCFILGAGKVQAKDAAAMDSVELTLNSGKKTTVIRVELMGVNGSTWTYRVTELAGQDLSHWVLGAGACTNHIVSYTPAAGAELGKDGNRNFYGIKWNTPDSFKQGEFSFTLDATYPAAQAQVLVKAGNPYVTGPILGPDCAQRPLPSATPTQQPTTVPTDEPTAVPTEEPTAIPTEEPTAVPTEEPTAVPTEEPTAVPTEEPTAVPTEEPTAVPTEEPTAVPTDEPTVVPTEMPDPNPSGASSAAIGDRVWLDKNANGVQDAGEQEGVANITVQLYTAAGVQVSEVQTGGDGGYRFEGLPVGQYSLVFLLPQGYSVSPKNVGQDALADSDADPATGQTAVTELTEGEQDLSWDMGLSRTTTSVEPVAEPGQNMRLFLPAIGR